MFRGKIAEHREVKPVGKCIYCGSIENLHDEHCIPESLNGFHVLGKASCQPCGRITSKFEGDYARDSLLPMRTAWNLRSKRSKKKRPTEFPMRFIKDGLEQTINVPVADHYSLIPMVEIGPPGYYPEATHPLGLKSGQCALNPFRIRPDEHIDYLIDKYGTDKIEIDYQIDINGFLRMIAKIAYCMTVWRFGLSGIKEVYVIPAILGKTKDVAHWVGSDGKQEIHEYAKDVKTDHIVGTSFTPNGDLHARVKLFKKSFTPEYDVIVGRMSDQLHGFYRSLGKI